MYTNPFNQQKDPAEVRRFINENGFGILVSTLGGKHWATHIPLKLDHDEAGYEVLHGHIARANPQWRDLPNGSEVMAIFHGPHAYISSAWYDHPNVPTWNYVAVHVYGTFREIKGDELVQSLAKLTDKYESLRLSKLADAENQQRVTVAGLPPKLMNDNLRALVGFEIKITEIQANYKLSQNRDAKNHANIAQELSKQSDPLAQQIAAEMMQSLSC
ncbi:MAG: FMN-binding negative transcriptional regulator [Cytophagia bacterium]|nr:MAG: FMN-binding negative transcriptional regulator [Runella sp.]TAG24392.1 MAG: FMN-binding negative transcriptional regulator [Cytophagales bacterium]TAG36426.1 MAG: FMN-binding negative transcriptional regulator [Cytophagia bacterium]TAG50853.1 MAG: FMN-binding negative transcriptional regulator [Runella slithyformis]TAG77980.1 MAG: FMN-binding negative transcriptional regulator [Cytophagales bacterium]